MAATTPPDHTTDPVLRRLQATSTLAVLALLFQFVTGAGLIPGGAPEVLHANAAIVLHVLTASAAISAVVLSRKGATPAWPAALAVVLFVLTIVEAGLGQPDSAGLHVLGAVVLTVGVVWLAAWSFSGSARSGPAA